MALNKLDYNERSSDSNTDIGEVLLEIQEKEDTNPDPLPEQLNAIEFLHNNQSAIKNSLFEYCKNHVYPKYEELMPREEFIDCYPPLNKISDLNKLLALGYISINLESKNEYSYIIMIFKTCLDFEHGISITIHKDKCIGCSEDLDYDDIYSDGGKIQNLKDSYIETQVCYEGIYSPNKYGILKSWQIYSAENTFKELLESNSNDKIKSLVEKSNWNIHTKFSSCRYDLLNLACENLNEEIANYLIGKGSDIDSINCWDQTGFFDEVERFSDARWQSDCHKEWDKDAYQKYKNEEKGILNIIEIYLLLGANPNSCNKNGHNYIEILQKKHGKIFLIESGVLREIEARISEATGGDNISEMKNRLGDLLSEYDTYIKSLEEAQLKPQKNIPKMKWYQKIFKRS